jgi:hypothetical protein
MYVLKFSLILVVLLIFASQFVTPIAFAEVSKDQAASVLTDANAAVTSSYQAVYKAEDAGANISSLLVQLNDAAGSLARAHLAYDSGNFDSSQRFTVQCQEKLTGFVAHANALREAAIQSHHTDFMVNVVGSLVGALGVVGVGFLMWFFLKRNARNHSLMRLQEHRLHFIIVIGIVALLVASPALSRLLVYPRTESFTEMWLLGPTHKAEGYPSTVSLGKNYSVFLGIGNHLGYCAYYMVQVKFRNQTQSAPNSVNHASSSLPSIFSIPVFVADQGTWELPLNFSFNYKYKESLTQIELYNMNMTLNGVKLRMSNYTLAWNWENNGYLANLFFELWIYNAMTGSFQYHERSVGFWFKISYF